MLVDIGAGLSSIVPSFQIEHIDGLRCRQAAFGRGTCRNSENQHYYHLCTLFLHLLKWAVCKRLRKIKFEMLCGKDTNLRSQVGCRSFQAAIGPFRLHLLIGDPDSRWFDPIQEK